MFFFLNKFFIFLKIHKDIKYLKMITKIMVNENDVIEVLKTVIDPEIGLDVVNLGLIYELKIENDNIYIKMTMTTPGCPLTAWIIADTENKLKQLPGIKDVKIDLVWDPPWSVERISEEAKKLLGL